MFTVRCISSDKNVIVLRYFLHSVAAIFRTVVSLACRCPAPPCPAATWPPRPVSAARSAWAPASTWASCMKAAPPSSPLLTAAPPAPAWSVWPPGVTLHPKQKIHTCLSISVSVCLPVSAQACACPCVFVQACAFPCVCLCLSMYVCSSLCLFVQTFSHLSVSVSACQLRSVPVR